MKNKLFFGDNLVVLREHVEDESVDLAYLDPPFNSQARYNVLFKSPREDVASAQAGAFLDFWSWETGEAEAAYHEIMTVVGGDAATLVKALRSALGESDMMAYLAMMALRLVELRRVLKPRGSLYLHCDPTASHYLKVLLDGIFGADRFRTEIIWKRTFAHGNVTKRFGDVTDTILYYTKGSDFVWNQQYRQLSAAETARKYPHEDPDGRCWQSVTLRNPGVRPNLHFPYLASNGVTYMPHPNGWSCNLRRLQQYDREGRLHFPAKEGGALRLKMYADESPGERLQSLWDDIPPIGAQARERVGYPTQKPIALLNRIVRASSNPGDVVLDAFCGCGTTVHAAQGSDRQWIGIDVSIHAIHVIEERLAEAFGEANVPKASGIPADYDSAARLAASNPFQFQWWANYLVGVHVLKEVKRGADRGIDGDLFFPNGPGRPYGRLLTSVKAGKNVSPAMVREFRGVIERENAEMGLFICLDRATRAMQQEAVVAGFAPVVHGRLPRLQILSIADWFEGRKPALPPLEHLPYAAFSKAPARAAPRAPVPDQPELPLTFKGGKDRAGNVAHFNPHWVVREDLESREGAALRRR